MTKWIIDQIMMAAVAATVAVAVFIGSWELLVAVAILAFAEGAL